MLRLCIVMLHTEVIKFHIRRIHVQTMPHQTMCVNELSMIYYNEHENCVRYDEGAAQ